MADSSGRYITIIVTRKIFTKPSLVVVSVQLEHEAEPAPIRRTGLKYNLDKRPCATPDLSSREGLPPLPVPLLGSSPF